MTIGIPPHLLHGRAWLLLCSVLVIHVAEEASTGFLNVFSPLILKTGAFFGLSIVMSRYVIWLSVIATLVAVLFALTPLVYRGKRWLVKGSYILAVLMIGNASLHLSSPLLLGYFLLGEFTSPLLIAASIWLVIRAKKQALVLYKVTVT